jgi:hypothetical protein
MDTHTEKTWTISDIVEYALALADRTEFGCPAIRSDPLELNMYFFDLIVNQRLLGVPKHLRDALEAMELWSNRGAVPLSGELQDALHSHSYSGTFYLTFEGVYCMKPRMAAYLLAEERYRSLSDEDKAFLQKIADDLSYGSPFWKEFCPDLTHPCQRR